MANLTWILERDIFPDTHTRLVEAAERAGHGVIEWTDDWWASEAFPSCSPPTIFHGSLENADRIARSQIWRPGALCRTEAFRCSAYYPNAQPWLVQQTYRVLPACELATAPDEVLAELGNPSRVFVRPDSPLKPFAGRVLEREAISLEALDHGFYFEDETIPVLVAPVLELGAEWRFVVFDHEVVTGSAYDPEGRLPQGAVHSGRAWDAAQEVARALPPPEAVFVLDLCVHEGELRLLELNPFSGADLYDCDRDLVVKAVAKALT